MRPSFSLGIEEEYQTVDPVTRDLRSHIQDEKFPGIHIAFGNPYGEHAGAAWRSGTHIDVVGLRFNIWLESDECEEQIMRDGRFLIAA